MVIYFANSFSLTLFPDGSFKMIGQAAYCSLLTAWKNAYLLAEINFIWIRDCYLIPHVCSNTNLWTCQLTERSVHSLSMLPFRKSMTWLQVALKIFFQMLFIKLQISLHILLSCFLISYNKTKLNSAV